MRPPIEDKGRAVLRAIAESAVGMLPFVGPITRLYQTTHPSQFAQDVERWQGDITATVNTLTERLAGLEAAHQPRLLLSALAVEVAVWRLRRAEPPPHRAIGLGEILAAFADHEAGLVAEAVHELADAELITITPSLGDGGDRVKASWPLIWLFEPLASGISPIRDAAHLARQALGEDDLCAQDIFEGLGWPVQRLNAALELVATFAPEGHVSRPAHPVFTLYGIHVDSGTRRRLRVFLGAGAKRSGQLRGELTASADP